MRVGGTRKFGFTLHENGYGQFDARLTAMGKKRGELLFSITTHNGLVVDTFRSGGKGGQNVNKVETGARIRHPESGASGQSTDQRSQWQNKRTALIRLTEHPKFKWWLHNKVREMDRGYTAEQWVEAQMADLRNFRVEIRDESGKWVEHDPLED